MQFDDFAKAHAADLVRLGAAVTGNQHDAEDFAQEALQLIAQHWRKVDAADARWSYARRLAINAHISRWRRRRVDEVLQEDVGVARHTFLDPGLSDELDESLDRALSRLPPRQRAAIVLKYYEELSTEDIANDLGISAGSVRSSLARALASLRASIEYNRSERQSK
jgi:RNA polymerase sigma-70 factor (sigma-E family)